SVSILLGDGRGGFGPVTSFLSGHSCQSVVVGDFNRDGKQDLAVANSGHFSILLGDGTGSFGPPANFGSFAQALALGDFNGDGKQDLAVANFNLNGTVSILMLQQCPSPTPTASATATASPTATATVTGTPTPPVLGNYPNASIPLSTDTTVMPDAAPSNATSINVSAPTNFEGRLEGDPTTGVVRVTNAHPAGTFTVAVKAL